MTLLASLKNMATYLTQADVHGRLFEPHGGFTLIHEPGEELLNVLL